MSRSVLDPAVAERYLDGERFTAEFLMGQSNVQKARQRLAERLAQLKIPYAVVGALAANAHGYLRATVDVDVLLNREGLERFKAEYLGRGYVEKFPGSRNLRDAVEGVDVDVVLSGDYPGDGLEKPVAFPDPAEVALEGDGFSLLPLETLIELKLASGMTAPHRLRDLADVLELIRINELPLDFSDNLDRYVHEKFSELWHAAQQAPEDG